MSRQIPPTRMEYLKLQRKLKNIQKSHKLLKDKLDGLLQKFLEIIFETKELRDLVNSELSEVWKLQMLAMNLNNKKFSEGIINHANANKSIELGVKRAKIMGVNVIEFSVPTISINIDYGTGQTSIAWDRSIKKLADSLDNLIKLAELEKKCYSLSIEIEATKRRVNALKYKIIPLIEKDLKFMRMVLDENERADKIRIMVMEDRRNSKSM